MKMTFVHKIAAIAATGIFVLSGAAFAQNDKAGSLEELLQMVRNAKVSESAEHRQREAEFTRQKANQAQLLRQAENTKASEEARSEKLETQYEEQDLLIQSRRLQLEERMGSLKELFGHLTSAAGDLRSAIDTSIVSAELPDRGEFLDELIDKMNGETQIPQIAEIERLWYELQRETVESGRVSRFTTTVSNVGGDQTEREVVRIGNFNLVSNGEYLNYEPDTDTVSVLPRQPAGHLQSAAAELQASTSGFTRVGVDPTGPAGGVLLEALINSPSVVEYWHDGQLVGYIITGVGIFAILLALWRFMVLSGMGSRVSAQLRADRANPNNPLGRVLKVAEDNPGIDGESLELKLEEAVLKERPAIESQLATLKIISMVAPLLGLLGTVVGMIVTFQAITIYGAGDPKAMAGGISSALVTTVLGLVVAIPTVLLHTILNSKAKRIIHILDEQSAGLIAEKAEKKK